VEQLRKEASLVAQLTSDIPGPIDSIYQKLKALNTADEQRPKGLYSIKSIIKSVFMTELYNYHIIIADELTKAKTPSPEPPPQPLPETVSKIPPPSDLHTPPKEVKMEELSVRVGDV